VDHHSRSNPLARSLEDLLVEDKILRVFTFDPVKEEIVRWIS